MSKVKPIPYATTLRVAVFEVLRESNSTFGMEITREIIRRSAGDLAPLPGAVSYVLRQLREDGHVDDSVLYTEAAAKRRDRRYVKLTAEGQRIADNQYRQLAGFFGLNRINPDA